MPTPTKPDRPVRQVHDIPSAIRAVVSGDPDYIDHFILTTSNSRAATPEQWARAAFEDVAGLGGQFIWRVLLGLRLKNTKSGERIAGWKIADRGDQWIRLEAHSWMMTGQLVIHLADDEVSLLTGTHYRRKIGRLIWTWLSAKHRSLAPDLLRDTHQRLFPAANA